MTYIEWLNKETMKGVIDKDYIERTGGLYVSERDYCIQMELMMLRAVKSNVFINGSLYKEYKTSIIKNNLNNF